MKVIVSFSGGKDSQACLIYACEQYGAENIEAVFCDTGWEHELTYNHVTNTCNSLGVKLVIISNKIGGFENLCKRMKWFPDTAHRMCTVRLKIQPMIDYILKKDDDILLIQGIRAAESESRSKMPCSADYFEAYQTNGKSLYRKRAVLNWVKSINARLIGPCSE